jgi:predicted RNase H-like HicB family nuclease
VTEVFPLVLDDVVVARYVLDEGLPASLSPRPYFHPVRTLGGTVVTDARPADHDWHLGVGLAIQDVGGVNFWGGPTYVRDRGYVDLDDHGRIEHVRWLARQADELAQELRWVGPDGEERLREERTVKAATVATVPRCWVLHFASSLRNMTDTPLRIGSPATHGREGAGYGGFFWRLPGSTSTWRIFSASAAGESGVHGTRVPWLSFGGGDSHGEYTLVFAVPDSYAGGSGARPWFVRVADYPGVCSAIAFEREVALDADEQLEVCVSVLVADGALEPESIRKLLSGAIEVKAQPNDA